MLNRLKARLQPRSLQQLILIGFIVVIAPLCLLLVKTTLAISQQTKQLSNYASESAHSSRDAEQLNQLSHELYRSARQYQILADSSLLQRQQQLLDQYQRTLTLQNFRAEQTQLSAPLFQQLNQLAETPTDTVLLQRLQQMTQTFNQQQQQLQQHALAALSKQAKDARQQLQQLSVGLVSLSCLLMLLLSRAISRPVSALAKQIRALGMGERTPEKTLSGPRELQTLGTELNWLGEQLEHLEQEKQRFLRHMSHELKTPLTTLREGADLLAEGVTGQLNHEQQEIAELLQQQSRELQQLISQLLDYNRLSQQTVLQQQQLPLMPLIHDSLAPFRLQLQQKAINLQLPEQTIECFSCAEMLKRILSNLISNATLYGSTQGWLKIEIGQQDDHLWLDISNKGPEIPSQDVPRLFEPFYQGENRRSGPVKGSGIGLSIAHDAALALNASLSLHHNQDNIVTFRLQLPLQDAA